MCEKEQRIFLVGIGMGTGEGVTVQAQKIIRSCDCLIGAKRMLDCARGICADPLSEQRPMFSEYRPAEIACYIDEDGKMKSLTPNFVVPVYSAAGYDIVCGTAVFFRCGCDGSETSLTFTDVLQIKYFLRGRDLRNFVLDSRLLRELCEGVK